MDDIKIKNQSVIDIVKPYLNRLKSAMKERDDDNGGEPLNAVDRGYHLACEHLNKEIEYMLEDMEKYTHTYQKVKPGKWLPFGGSFRCSCCASMPEFADITLLHYCPNCGHLMEVEE